MILNIGFYIADRVIRHVIRLLSVPPRGSTMLTYLIAVKVNTLTDFSKLEPVSKF